MDDNFDEFGNFIGQEYSDSHSEDTESNWEDEVEVVENVEDEQSVCEPLVKRKIPVASNHIIPPNWNFHYELLQIPQLCRNFVLVGLSKHGKTSLANMLSPNMTDLAGEIRKMTIFTNFTSTIHQTSSGKSFVLNFADTPGHWNFDAELQNLLDVSDHHVLVVDASEGCKLSRKYSNPDLIIISKLDRLILDMRLPPKEAYERLDWLINELKGDWYKCIFASAKFNFTFSLSSMTKLYSKYKGMTCTLQPENFTEYILAPIYKLFGCALTAQSEPLYSLGISLSKQEWNLEYDERITLIMSRYLEAPLVALVDALVDLGPLSFDERNLNRSGKKIYSSLGPVSRAYEQIDEQSWIPFGTNRVSVPFVPIGCWYINRDNSPTEISISMDEKVFTGHVRLGIEPLSDNDETLLALGDSLTKMLSRFLALRFNASETGEFWLYGPGELYLDSVAHELTKIAPKFSISQPWAEFRETIKEESHFAIPTKTANGNSSITVVAKPLADFQIGPEELIWFETEDCILLGPQNHNADTMEAIIDGFKWSISKGPLIESAVQGICFTICNLEIGGSIFQLTPTMRRACCAAMLVASPRLLEPEVLVSVVGKLEAGKALYSEIAKRGGLVDCDEPIYGTNLYLTQGRLPLMDSFGLEIDIKCQADQRDEIFVTQEICGWIDVTGDPLDKSQSTKQLEAAQSEGRARDFMLKERRRKGLNIEPQVAQFVDAEILPLLV